MAPLKPQEGEREARTAKRKAPGKHASGPTGYREVGCGTLTLYDGAGERLQTVQYARMPEHKKVTLGEHSQAEAQAILGVRPDLRRVYLADGAGPNWELLTEVEQALGGRTANEACRLWISFMPVPTSKTGCDAIWGRARPGATPSLPGSRCCSKKWTRGPSGSSVPSSTTPAAPPGLAPQADSRGPDLFPQPAGRMQYAAYQRQHLPIGSGVMEAACKTLVTQRLKGSGMAWTMTGGQAILTLRSLLQSGRWALAWPLFAADFRSPVVIPDENTEMPLPLAA